LWKLNPVMKFQKPKYRLNRSKRNNFNGTTLRLVPFFLVVLFPCFLFSQNKNTVAPAPKLLQFSGIVVEGDSLKGLPFTSIVIRSKKTGAVSDYYGFFTLVASPGDIVEFVNIGYKDVEYIIPDTLKATHYSVIQTMRRDTVLLKEVSVYPWPSKEEFKEAFLKLKVPNSDLDRAKQNLAAEEMRELVKGVELDAYGNYRYSMQQQYAKLQYLGQYPPNNLLNPFAWAQFIKSWKKGKLKIQ
jgi:hypothetical protein